MFLVPKESTLIYVNTADVPVMSYGKSITVITLLLNTIQRPFNKRKLNSLMTSTRLSHWIFLEYGSQNLIQQTQKLANLKLNAYFDGVKK